MYYGWKIIEKILFERKNYNIMMTFDSQDIGQFNFIGSISP